MRQYDRTRPVGQGMGHGKQIKVLGLGGHGIPWKGFPFGFKY
jgi:hypothetical protein